MKKILILTIALVSLFSCSSDDKDLDPIVGKWYVFSKDGVETDECERKGNLTFNEDGSTTSVYYESLNNECLKGGDEGTATWKNKGNNVYSITRGKESNDATLVFSDNNNTFTIPADNMVYKRK